MSRPDWDGIDPPWERAPAVEPWQPAVIDGNAGAPAGDEDPNSSEFIAATAALRFRRGGTVLDTPAVPPAVWGRNEEVLWAAGESLLLCGPPGVGKTTLAGQLLAARIGCRADVLGYPVQPTERRVLYLAMDRPRQIRRALSRHFDEADRQTLDDRLTLLEGPPPRDLARQPDLLLALATEAGADTLVIDSVKDAAVGISEDEVAANLNRAVQACVSDGVEVLGLHHQRKEQAGAKPPRDLAGVYGSTWLTAGAGSVVLLWGQPGDPVVELRHLKQPAGEVGPLEVEHDHHHGTTTINRGWDALAWLRHRPHGGTTTEAACAWFEKQKPTANEVARAKRRLDALVRGGLAHRVDETSVDGIDEARAATGGRQPAARYVATTDREEEPR